MQWEAVNIQLALEVYFSRALGFSLLTLGMLNVLLTGSVPLSSRLSEGTYNRHVQQHFIPTIGHVLFTKKNESLNYY